MSGVFSVLSDAQAGMFRLQQARKPWEKEIAAKDARGQLAEKAARAAQPFQLTPQQMRDHATAKAALEEARRVGGPKAAAEQRLEQVERKIEELKLAMRFAHGDRQKLAQLAHAAAMLAREAGRAAKDYAVGVANAAEMGLPGGAGTTGSAIGSAIGSSETTVTTTVTSLTVRQTEWSVSLRVASGGDGPGDARSVPPPEPPPEGPSLELPPDLGRMIDGALSGLAGDGGFVSAGAGSDRAHATMQRMLADHDLKMSRYKEADAFGRRVEDVLHVAKRVVGEAKIANEWDESEKRRKERRDGFKLADTIIDAAQKEVDALRQAAFGSSADATDPLDGLEGWADAADAGGIAEIALPAVAETVPASDRPAVDLLT